MATHTGIKPSQHLQLADAVLISGNCNHCICHLFTVNLPPHFLFSILWIFLTYLWIVSVFQY